MLKIKLKNVFFSGEEHWLGLENIHRLTANNARIDYELKVDLETWTGEWFVATYSHPKFYIDGKVNNGRINERGITFFSDRKRRNAPGLKLMQQEGSPGSERYIQGTS